MNSIGRPPSGMGGRGGNAPRGSMASSMGRPPPGSAMRVPGTGMATARPGSRGGVGGTGALSSVVQVTDRPVTRQGLAGMKTASQGPQRQVQDKSFWLGLLRGKITELSNEIGRLNKEINQFNQENASYVGYEKRAETLAAEIKVLQGQMADYNTLVDKLNTNSSFDDLKEDYEILQVQNERESKAIDELFAQRQDKEQQIKHLEVETDQQRRMTESMVADMPPMLRAKYAQLKNINVGLQSELEAKQHSLDAITDKISRLEEEVSQSQIKHEAVGLYEKIWELEEKRNTLLQEMERDKKSSPAEERERLLKLVKDDNQEIARMENRISDLKEKIEKVQDEIRQLDMDLEEHHGERTAKYKELRKREETMQEFLDGFEQSKSTELDQRKQSEANIVTLLERVSRAMVQSKYMPNANDFQQMKDDLNFKETEMYKSSDTNKGLEGERARLQMDFEKVEQLESKISDELNSLKGRINKMTEEIEIYADIDGLKKQAEDKRQLLTKEKEELLTNKDSLKKDVQHLSSQYEAMKVQLQENETHVQLGNLERKWQHLEQNNFAIKEYVAQKTAESDYRPTKENIVIQLRDINQHIILTLNKSPRMATL